MLVGIAKIMDTAITAAQHGTQVGWKASLLAVITGGPSLWLAIINNETFVIYSGIATGAFAAIWGIWNFGMTVMLKTMIARLKQSEDMVDQLRADKEALETAAARSRVHLAELEESSGERKIPYDQRPK